MGAVLVRERDDDRHAASSLVLLGRREAGRAFYPDVWDVLGGHLEPGETTEQALVDWTGVPRNRSSEEHAEVSWFAVEDACRLALAHPAYPALLRRVASGTPTT